MVSNARRASVAAYAVIYRRENSEYIPKDVRKDFLERVAAMACVPYLREALHHIAAEIRLGDIVIPIIKLGEVEIDVDDKELSEEPDSS